MIRSRMPGCSPMVLLRFAGWDETKKDSGLSESWSNGRRTILMRALMSAIVCATKVCSMRQPQPTKRWPCCCPAIQRRRSVWRSRTQGPVASM